MAKWRNKIELKKYLSNENDNKSVLKVVNGIIPQIKFVLASENRYLLRTTEESVAKENIEYYVGQLEEVLEEFDWIEHVLKREKMLGNIVMTTGVKH
jgi:hypothetical protein